MFEQFSHYRISTSGATINLVKGGTGKPLLLLHGYPQTHIMWHKVAPLLCDRFTVICPDLRGYGDSDKPTSDPIHVTYSKRATARDQVEMMAALGFERFFAAGHDRGGRVLHRLLLDYPNLVEKAAVLDIVPTRTIFETVNQELAIAYEHWFFLCQPDNLPERLIGKDPEFYLRTKLKKWSANPNSFTEAAMAEYIRCFSNPATIHATCEDYRAAATIDLEHDEADINIKIPSPLLVLWGAKGIIARCYDVLKTWQERAVNVSGKALDCGHFLPEEAPQETVTALRDFFCQ
ncbi:MAG TPA: alpha/beta hydrolase [Cyanobacteria bacterium UBA11149]|nr:alpha/beta hydrolase [Cyanobacteria bacterium UBA11367]HBE56106.1 alpha/beta hydrolase [Cyanobacteria bacterium UBA11366]HBK65841.1 alpha/beta hydrolase [Cyanobacteria bacterium UBA11166]HBR75149.1 alpha/beta hydrolase [Cyanobacteria bacterium UBA11159]HBS70104.1 alpha/beta hydrolase [Cyanobacteria bacterium UBA11153]HBW90724.1 alpha/beta hydrolase [Cyanobacteria bacterium UBA11149]HCA93445.1 alpha/beta hydrolase [Cyanobacteria bacterium UBA9226]